MDNIKHLQNEITALKSRNQKVEANKAWETSLTKKIILVLLTYAVIVITLYALGLPNPFTNAIIPSIAFFLSTLTLPLFKKFWVKMFYRT